MMISAAPLEARQSQPSSQPTNCSPIREQRGLPIAMLRMAGLEGAATLLGKGRLADELCITVRALNYKMNAERGVSDGEVRATAAALEERAELFLTHARKLRAVVDVKSNGEGVGR
ncbi:hypothetical protein E5673_01465 [Sphingomonas sp. PAMC26645]|uniref:hypothetical protein n=1 Tax=Sphingomonas sp. PAMC26645 TaxID=2565555 RepID=UPI00109D90F5|nr:hypothetical protein [Sphingomonas sp. PAMC26645]QCB41061.1 hypothetical protein E5673_01465 [Sphingomonas sp. PAMC26645]